MKIDTFPVMNTGILIRIIMFLDRNTFKLDVQYSITTHFSVALKLQKNYQDFIQYFRQTIMIWTRKTAKPVMILLHNY